MALVLELLCHYRVIYILTHLLKTYTKSKKMEVLANTMTKWKARKKNSVMQGNLPSGIFLARRVTIVNFP